MKSLPYYLITDIPNDEIPHRCKECGSYFNSSDNFCSECGENLSWYKEELNNYKNRVGERKELKKQRYDEFFNDVFDYLDIDTIHVRELLKNNSKSILEYNLDCFTDIGEVHNVYRYINETWDNIIKPVLEHEKKEK